MKNNLITCKWRKIYDEVKFLQKILNYAKFDINGRPPIIDLPKETIAEIEEQISELKMISGSYLDSIGIKKRVPKWKYSHKDESTWVSSTEFAYTHLL